MVKEIPYLIWSLTFLARSVAEANAAVRPLNISRHRKRFKTPLIPELVSIKTHCKRGIDILMH